jgi:F0F1-type ATP synthase delta subunit
LRSYVLYKQSSNLIPIEIKSAKTLNKKFFKGINVFKKITPKAIGGYLIYSGEPTPDTDSIKVRHFTNTYKIFE